MKHFEEEILWDFITGDLGLEDRTSLENHLKECPDCRQHYLSALALHSGLLALEPEQPSASFAKNVLTRIDYEVQLEKSSKFWLKFTRVAIIGAMVLAVVSVFVLLDAQKNNIVLDDKDFSIIVQMLLGVCLLWAFYGLDRLLKRFIPISSDRL